MKLREQAYESFRGHLLAKRIRPGQFVSQRELVALTGLSLAAIREMIPRLEADGLIVTVPQRGLQIAAVDLALVRNAFHLRLILEREAITHFVAAATDAEVAAQVDAHRAIAARAAAGETGQRLLDEAQAVDWGFHDALVERLGNDLITAVYRVNSLKVRLIRLEQSMLSAAVLQPVLAEHSRILDAIAARDTAGAVAALEAHLAGSRRRALDHSETANPLIGVAS